jgi:carboxylesterase type B
MSPSAVFANLNNNRADLRAYHFSEVPIVFGTYNSSQFQAASATEIALSKYIQSAWVAFARDPANGLTNFAWPKYDPNTASIARLGSSANKTGVSFASSSDFDVGCAATESQLSLVEQILALVGF